MGPFKRYARAVRADQESYISLDEGLSVISKHAKDVLGYDAIVLLLDELVLWLAGYIGDTTKISAEAQKVSKLVESAEHERPAPIVSFAPRQRDLRDLVRKDADGAEITTLFDTLKYWDGRFDSIRLDDRNLPAIAHERLLKPKDDPGPPAARRGLHQGRQRPAADLGHPARHPRRAGRPGVVPSHLPVQPGVRARHGRHLQRAAAGTDRAEAHVAAPRRLPRCLPSGS